MFSYLVALLALCSVTLGLTFQEHQENGKTQIMDASVDCADKLGATPDDIKELMERKIPSTRAGLCVVTCVNKQFGIMGADGKIARDAKMENLEKVKELDADMYTKMSSVWTTCRKDTADDADECMTGINLVKCMESEGAKVGLTKEVMGF